MRCSQAEFDSPTEQSTACQVAQICLNYGIASRR